MTESRRGPEGERCSAAGWYALSPEEVATRLGVDPAKGLSAAKAAELLAKNGPNALPAEAPAPGWRRSSPSTGATCRSSSWRPRSPRW